MLNSLKSYFAIHLSAHLNTPYLCPQDTDQLIKRSRIKISRCSRYQDGRHFKISIDLYKLSDESRFLDYLSREARFGLSGVLHLRLLPAWGVQIGFHTKLRLLQLDALAGRIRSISNNLCLPQLCKHTNMQIQDTNTNTTPTSILQ